MGTWRCSRTTVVEIQEGRNALVAPDGAGRLDRWLAEATPLTRGRVQELIEQGRVTVEGRPARPSLRLHGGERVELDLPPTPAHTLLPEDLDVPLLYQDESVLVVDKPAGLVVHPAAGHRDGTLVNALLPALEGAADEDAPDRPGIVHRLDRGTSGLLVVARTPDAVAHLSAQFAEHSVERLYLALVWGAPRDLSGTIDAPLGRHPTERRRFAVTRDGRRAVTHYQTLQTARIQVSRAVVTVSLLQCRLETGRTHQVRVHLAHLGHPVLCDPLYGRRGAPPEPLFSALEPIDHQLLHARRLAFTHPVSGERMSFESPPPADFRAALEAAGIAWSG